MRCILENRKIAEAYGKVVTNEASSPDDAPSIITDDIMDLNSVKKWCCFTDEKLNLAIKSLLDEGKVVESALSSVCEANERMDGRDWKKLSFGKKVLDKIRPSVNYDGSPKGWFETRKFPTEVIKASDLTLKGAVDVLRAGKNIKVDYSGATQSEKDAVAGILTKAHDFLTSVEQSKFVDGVSDVAGLGGAVVGGKVGGVKGAVIGGATAKGVVVKLSNAQVDAFNKNMVDSGHPEVQITDADRGRPWYDAFISFVVEHPYATAAVVVAAFVLYRKREWVWNRIKYGFKNLFQGKVIATYAFKLVNGVGLVCEYDLRYNKWRLLYDALRWKNDNVAPSKESLISFLHTSAFKNFVHECENGMSFWFKNSDRISSIVENDDSVLTKEQRKLVKSVLKDKDDILSSFSKGEWMEG